MYACTIQIVSLLTSISVRIVTGHMHGVSNEVELQLYVCILAQQNLQLYAWGITVDTLVSIVNACVQNIDPHGSKRYSFIFF